MPTATAHKPGFLAPWISHDFHGSGADRTPLSIRRSTAIRGAIHRDPWQSVQPERAIQPLRSIRAECGSPGTTAMKIHRIRKHRCGAIVLAALDHWACAIEVICDPYPLSALGEVHALRDGRRTYQVRAGVCDIGTDIGSKATHQVRAAPCWLRMCASARCPTPGDNPPSPNRSQPTQERCPSNGMDTASGMQASRP
jgi:hypothetical protein